MSRWSIKLTVAFPLLVVAAPASSQEPYSLEEWEGTAQLLPNPGPGERVFRLVARVRRIGDESPGSGPLSVRVRLPDGRIETHALAPGEGPRSGRIPVYVPARAVWNIRPDQLRLGATLVGKDGRAASNELIASSDDFPTPSSGHAPVDRGPFGWGQPLEPTRVEPLSRPGPAGLRFIRVPEAEGTPAFLIASTELSNAQAATLLPDYAPPSNRSDEFPLEDPAQPAFGLTPVRAEAVMKGLAAADPGGLAYRLPTPGEWERAARAGQSTAFWWGDEPSHPAGANYLGPEPANPIDSTAPVQPSAGAMDYRPNSWGLFHTFGNVAEWTASSAGRFVRMGGNFRTEPPPEAIEAEGDSPGPDLFVGVRPVFTLTTEQATELARRQIAGDPRCRGIQVAVDVGRLTATLRGEVDESAWRRIADRQLAVLWWLAAVENQVATPRMDPAHLVRLGSPVGRATSRRELGRELLTIPLAARWVERLPVIGSEWYANVLGPGGVWSYRIEPRDVGGRKPLPIVVDRTRFPAGTAVSVFLSLGRAAATPAAPEVVSEPRTIRVP